MKREYWHESITEQSWKKLQELAGEIDFVTIGGWAVWLWTKQHKSRDIDIIVGFDALSKLGEKYELRKNDRLKKYEIKLDGFDIDIYVPFYSKLALPAEELLKEKTKIEGINTLGPEALLILKQGAEIDRRKSTKGDKDTIDILTLLAYAPINFDKYRKILVQNGKENYSKELVSVVNYFNPREAETFLGMKINEYPKFKKEIIRKIKQTPRNITS